MSGLRQLVICGSALLALSFVWLVPKASAVSIDGVPVGALGSETIVAACDGPGGPVGPACYDGTYINFYIPIDDELGSPFHGTYGVDIVNVSGTDYFVGTVRDTEYAPFGQSLLESGTPTLTMYVMFEPTLATQQYDAHFSFYDLDLDNINDPVDAGVLEFLEEIQFFGWDGTTAFALTDVITVNEQTSDLYDYVVSGNHDSQSIILRDFPATNIRSYAKLTFNAYMDGGSGKWKNTMESMKTYLVAVPEPSSLLLLGFGLLALVGWHRRQGRSA